jgi:hypothetical protein
MTKFILVILFIVFVIPWILRSIIRFLFGGPYRQEASSKRGGNSSSSFSTQKKSGKKKKVIEKDEGEYVDYVEIREK